jgi:hypothetical protein
VPKVSELMQHTIAKDDGKEMMSKAGKQTN